MSEKRLIGRKDTKKSPIAGEPSADNSKRILRDLLIIVTVFVTLYAFNSATLAVEQYSYAGMYDNWGERIYHSVKGNQTTTQFTVVNGTASFICLYQPNGDWFAVGYCKGWTQNGTLDYIWVSAPYYYVDRQLGGEGPEHYMCWLYGPAPIGIISHEYYVCGITSMGALIDSVVKKTEGGYSGSGNRAFGMTETHDTRDQMNSHFFVMKAGESLFAPYAFHDDYKYHPNDPPYSVYKISDTEWTATGKGSS